LYSSLNATALVCLAVSALAENGGRGQEFFDAEGFRVDALEDGEQFHVSIVHIRFGPWQLGTAYSQRDV
jgi:hypothetical protein